MTVRERVLCLRLLEKQDKNPEYVKEIGVWVNVVRKASNASEKGESKCLK